MSLKSLTHQQWQAQREPVSRILQKELLLGGVKGYTGEPGEFSSTRSKEEHKKEKKKKKEHQPTEKSTRGHTVKI